MNRKLIIWSVVLGLFVVIAILASQVGGLAIRTVRQSTGAVRFTNADQKFSLCSPFLLSWTKPSLSTPNSPVAVILRDQSNEREIGMANIGDTQTRVQLPAQINGQASLLLRNKQTNEYVASTLIATLAPGPDCFGQP